MKARVIVQIQIDKTDKKLCDPYCPFNNFGTFCDLFQVSHSGSNKRVRQCMMREAIKEREILRGRKKG